MDRWNEIEINHKIYLKNNTGFFFHNEERLSDYSEQVLNYNLVKKYSSLTHTHQLSIMASFIYVRFMLNILKGKDKNASYNLIRYTDYSNYFRKEIISEFTRIINKDIRELKLNANSYQQAVVGAINLGGDTNTIASLVGGVAGVIYGVDDIPNEWLDKLKRKDLINNIILNLVMQLY